MGGRARGSPPRQLGLLEAPDVRSRYVHRVKSALPVGTRVAGDLVILGHLAGGRVANLYQVWSSGEWCAYTCKLLAPELCDDRRAPAALRRESRILRGLRHPGVVRWYGHGEHEGQPFVLLEYLDGPSLFDLLESAPGRRLATGDAIRTAIHIGSALYHLHRHGWLHLDLKPANMIVRERLPVLVDLDGARRADSARPVRALGTGPYMAPEHARREALGPTADVWGLGALLYEMVTGRWPFEEAYAEGAVREHEQPQQGGAEPPPPSRWADGVSPSLEQTILRCLAPEPAARFPSMHALMLGLVAELDEPVAIWPSGVETDRRQTPR
jgi:eukaryotic-like serine/threonine-protein kinase